MSHEVCITENPQVTGDRFSDSWELVASVNGAEIWRKSYYREGGEHPLTLPFEINLNHSKPHAMRLKKGVMIMGQQV